MPKRHHVPKQTPINREPLAGCIIQASPACKWQNGSFDDDFHQWQTPRPMENSTREPNDGASDRISEGQAATGSDPVLALPGFFMEPVPLARSGDYKYPAGCVIFRVAFIHKGRRFSKYIGHDGDMSAAEARAIAAEIIADVKTGLNACNHLDIRLG